MEVIKYIKLSYKEVAERVTWPSLKKIQNSAIIVALFSVLFSLIVSGIDFIIKEVIKIFFSSF